MKVNLLKWMFYPVLMFNDTVSYQRRLASPSSFIQAWDWNCLSVNSGGFDSTDVLYFSSNFHVRAHTHTHTHTHTHSHTHTHTQSHTRSHTHTRTHTHTR